MTHIPKITSIGLAPELHADRVIADMLRYFAKQHEGVMEKMKEAVPANGAGNPLAQIKMAERIRKLMGPYLIDMSLSTGKRGRYAMMLFDWCVVDSEYGKEIKDGQFIPLKPWLACCANVVIGKGNYSHEFRGQYALRITHHALSRLAQRFDARTVDDLILAVRSIWYSYRQDYMAWVRTESAKDIKEDVDPMWVPDGKQYVFKFKGQSAIAVARNYPNIPGVTISTILYEGVS